MATKLKTNHAHRLERRCVHYGPLPSSQGGASSAAKMAHKVGVTDHGGKVWCGREGWVTWTEIQRSVNQAFARWHAIRAPRDPSWRRTAPA